MVAAPIRLIVNADDFGMTLGVNRAIAELHSAGALASTTLMACGAAFDDAVRIAREQPTLGVGCHVVLVDGKPTGDVPNRSSLLRSSGDFQTSMARFATAVAARFTRPEHIEHEVAAQIFKLQDAGVQVTHVDTHKHTHLMPLVARAVMRAARSQGVRHIRNPFEPAWCSAMSPAPLARRAPFRALHRFKSFFDRLLSEEGMTSTDASIGLIATGSMNAALLRSILQAAPAGTYELVCHPGYHDQELDRIKTKLRTSREVERDALLQVVPNLAPTLIEQISFADLP